MPYLAAAYGITKRSVVLDHLLDGIGDALLVDVTVRMILYRHSRVRDATDWPENDKRRVTRCASFATLCLDDEAITRRRWVKDVSSANGCASCWQLSRSVS